MGEIRYADALAKYDEAFAISADAALLYNSGRALEALGRYPEALERLRSFQVRATPALLARVPNLGGLIADIEKQTCMLSVKVDEPGATVRLGDSVLGRTPLASLRVSAKKGVRLEVTRDGFDADVRTIDLPGAGNVQVEVDLLPKDRSAVLVVDSPVKGATVFVDGVKRGQTPTEVRILAGAHSVRLSARNYEDTASEVLVSPGERRTLLLEPSEGEIYERWWFWTIAGAAVAGGAVAGITYAALTEGPADVGSIAPGQTKVLSSGSFAIRPIPIVSFSFD